MAVKDLTRHLRPLDLPTVILLAVAALVGTIQVFSAGRGDRVVVERDGRTIFAAPLTADRTTALAGPLGETVLAIRDGAARIVASPCPHQVCLGMGAISRAGEIIACVPNHLLVRVEGEATERDRGYDFISR